MTRKQEQQEINLIKAHYIGVLKVRNSLTSYTINAVNRLCEIIEIRNELQKDIKKRGVFIDYNNGGGQVGTRQNDSVKLLATYEESIRKLTAQINEFNNVTVDKHGEEINFRKYEKYFTSKEYSEYKPNEEQLFVNTSIIDYCAQHNLLDDEATYYINLLQENKITHSKVLKILKERAEAINKIINCQKYDTDTVVNTYWLNNYIPKYNPDKLEQEINKYKKNDYSNEEIEEFVNASNENLEQYYYNDFVKWVDDTNALEKDETIYNLVDDFYKELLNKEQNNYGLN